MFKGWRQMWREWRCEHYWRPCAFVCRKPGTRYVTGYQAAKTCDYCGQTVLLTTAEFYAQFGRMPLAHVAGG